MQEDLTLLKSLRQRDSRALAAVYDKYGPALYGVIVRICKNPELAEDLLQETFIKIWKKADSYDPTKGRFYTWAYRIARNTALNGLRNRHDLIQKEELGVYTNEDDSTENEVDWTKLNGTIEKLDEQHRKAIVLVYFEGLTHREAHKVMDVPLGTFKSYVRQALRELRSHLSGLTLLLSLLTAMML